MPRLCAFLVFIPCLIIFLSSCSDTDRLLTGIDSNSALSTSQLPIGVSDISTDGTPLAGMGVFGLFELSLDPEKVNAELTSLKTGSLTDVLEAVDITNFLQIAPCTNCVKIKSVSLDSDENLIVTIGIKHPFETGDPLKPITGRNRADLHVFNVEGIIVSNTPANQFNGLGESIADFNIMNADGYTGYLDDSLDTIFPTDATIHPYILHFDDYSAGNFNPSNPMGFESVTIPPPNGNLVMAMGSDYDYQDYVFDLPFERMDLILAVGCTYAVSSASKSQRFTPEYRIPQHNKKAASEVDVTVISNNLEAGDTLSTAELEIHVVDISHGVTVGEALNEMLSDSSVSEITIDIPGVLSTPHVVDVSSPTGSGHDPSDPLIYTTTISNSASALEGIYAVLVKVTDSYAPGQNSSPLLNGMDGIKRVDPFSNPLTGLFQISEFATYMTFEISVEIGNEPPVAVLEPDPASCNMGDRINFDGTNSYDTDGSITLYEFDFDWDGVELNFVADASNSTGLAQSFPYPAAGSYTAGLRVTDDMSAIDYDSVQVTVSALNVIYVDDSNTGPIENGTMTYPYNTIQEGLNAATAGYQVWVDDSGNDYIGPILTKSNVILKSVNWDSDDGGNQASIIRNSQGTIVNSVADSTIDGFKVHGASATGGFNVSGNNAIVRNCWITGIGLTPTSTIVEGMRIGFTDNVLIEKCEFSNIQLNTSSGILDCIYVMGNFPNIKTTNVTIRQCKIHDFDRNTGSGILIPVYFNFVDGITFENNLIYDIDSYDNGINIGVYFNDGTNGKVANCTITDILYGWGSIYVGSECTGFNGYNNIMDSISMGLPSALWNYNCLITGTNPPGTGNITGNPMFVNPGTDYHLLPGSPCIDTGDPGILDPDSSRSDMGCYGGPGGNW